MLLAAMLALSGGLLAGPMVAPAGAAREPTVGHQTCMGLDLDGHARTPHILCCMPPPSKLACHPIVLGLCTTNHACVINAVHDASTCRARMRTMQAVLVLLSRGMHLPLESIIARDTRHVIPYVSCYRTMLPSCVQFVADACPAFLPVCLHACNPNNTMTGMCPSASPLRLPTVCPPYHMTLTGC